MLNHCVIGSDVNLHAAVLSATLFGVVAGHWIVIGQALGLHAIAGNTAVDKIGLNGVGAVLRQFLINCAAAGVVGVTINLDVGVGVIDQRRCEAKL